MNRDSFAHLLALYGAKRLHPRLVQRGFTLIELMVTIAILAIIASLAVPSFTQQIRRMQVSRDTQDFIQTLQNARNKAILVRRTQSLNFGQTTVTNNAWNPTANVIWDGTYKPSSSGISFNMLGYVDGMTGESVCYSLQSSLDTDIKSFIVLQRNGSLLQDKTRTSCQN